MIVTFTTKSFANIVMFGDVAHTLLKLMGHSGSVPGAIKADDVGEYLDNLKQGLGHYQELETDQGREDEQGEPVISMHTRAQPLIDLLSSAQENNHDVSWKSGT